MLDVRLNLRGTLPRRVLGLGLLAAAASCSGDERPAAPDRPTPSQTSSADGAVTADGAGAAGLAPLARVRPHAFPPSLQAKVAAVDPRVDAAAGPPERAARARAEVLAERVHARLSELGGALTSGAAFDSLDPAEALATGDFRPAFLARERGATVHASLGFVVSRAALVPAEAAQEAPRGPRALRNALQLCFAPLLAAEGSLERVSFETDRIVLDGDRTRTESVVRAAGVHGRSSSGWQQNARWSLTWREVEGTLRLERMDVSELEEVLCNAGATSVLRDASRFVLGDGPSAELLRSDARTWNAQLDRTLGTSIFGHNGLAVGDADGDGRDDVYVCQPGALPNQLWLQDADGRARDAAAEAGLDVLDLSRSALWLDLDNDGDQDLVLATSAELVVYENDGATRFSPVTRRTLDSIHSLAAADVDGDGRLDLYVCRYSQTDSSTPTPYHDADDGPPNALLRNAGELQFEDVTEALGLSDNNHRYSFAAVFADHDLDGDLDLYVANDFGRNNLYEREGGRFRDVAPERDALDVAAGMSAAWADYDGDGLPDLYVGNMYSAAGGRLSHQPGFRSPASSAEYQRHARGNTLLRNRGDGTYEDTTLEAGVALGRWAWASPFVDLDSDGFLDLAVANGYLTGETAGSLCSFFWRHVVGLSPERGEKAGDDYEDGWTALNTLQRYGWTFAGREPNVLYVNTGDGRFCDASSVAGFDFPDDARALAVCDWDRDGAPDLWTTARTAPRLRLLRNGAPIGDGFVALRLRGTRSNRDAIGARVEVTLDDGRRLVRTVVAGDGFLSQSSKWVHVGLGADGRVSSADVVWPDGRRQAFGALRRGGRYLLVEDGELSELDALDLREPAGLLSADGGWSAAPAQAPSFTPLAVPVPARGLVYLDASGERRELGAASTTEARALCVVLFAIGEKGVSVHALSPGPLKTRAASGIGHFDELINRAAERAPMHMLASIEDVGAYAAFLASDEAARVTGGVHAIDGGYSIIG